MSRCLRRASVPALGLGLAPGFARALGLVLVASLAAGSAFAESAPDRPAPEAPPITAQRPARPIVERWRDATPAERRFMRERMRERHEAASPRERRRFARVLRGLERALPEFSAIERLVLIRALARLPEDERRAYRQRLRGIDHLEAAERRALVAELEALIDAVAGEVDRLERNRARWQDMSEAEREEYRAQMKKLRAMSVEERRALIEEMERRAGRGEASPDPDPGAR